MNNVLLVVDNSNIHVQTKRLYGADARFNFATFESDFYKDFTIVAKQMAGSTLSATEGFWNKMKRLGFEIIIYERQQISTGYREKSVDTALAVRATEAIIRHKPNVLALVSGDLDMRPLVELAKRYACEVHLWSYYQSSSRALENLCDHIFYIDDHIDSLIFYQDAFGNTVTHIERCEQHEYEKWLLERQRTQAKTAPPPADPTPPKSKPKKQAKKIPPPPKPTPWKKWALGITGATAMAAFMVYKKMKD